MQLGVDKRGRYQDPGLRHNEQHTEHTNPGDYHLVCFPAGVHTSRKYHMERDTTYAYNNKLSRARVLISFSFLG